MVGRTGMKRTSSPVLLYYYRRYTEKVEGVRESGRKRSPDFLKALELAKLCDSRGGVVSAICEMAAKDPKQLYRLAPIFFSLPTQHIHGYKTDKGRPDYALEAITVLGNRAWPILHCGNVALAKRIFDQIKAFDPGMYKGIKEGVMGGIISDEEIKLLNTCLGFNIQEATGRSSPTSMFGVILDCIREPNPFAP